MRAETAERLIRQAREFLAMVDGLQDPDGESPSAPVRQRASALGERYRSWYAEAMEALSPTDQKAFQYQYVGIPVVAPGIKKFLESPYERNFLWKKEEPNPLVPNPWMYSASAQFAGPLNEQIVILERAARRRPDVLRTPGGDVPLPRNLVGHLDALEGFLAKHPFEKNVFLMMRYRDHNDHIAQIIKAGIEAAGFHPVLAKDVRIADELGPNVMASLLCCQYGIALFDEPEEGQDVNPNVAYELGIMHFLDRPTLLLKSQSLRTLPSDILAKLYNAYNPESAGDLIAAVKGWLAQQGGG